jgi:YD repeat-containing protein
MTDASGKTTYTYDAAGRLSTQTAPAGKTITYTYDSVGNRATMVDPDAGTTTYSFDAGRRLSSLVNPLAERTTWQYDPVGRITTLTHANATRAVHTYNAAGWVTGLVNAKSDGTTLTSHDYTYDALGSPAPSVPVQVPKRGHLGRPAGPVVVQTSSASLHRLDGSQCTRSRPGETALTVPSSGRQNVGCGTAARHGAASIAHDTTTSVRSERLMVWPPMTRGG